MLNDPSKCLTKDQPPFKLEEFGGFSKQSCSKLEIFWKYASFMYIPHLIHHLS